MDRRTFDCLLERLGQVAREQRFSERVAGLPYLKADDILCFRRDGRVFAHEVLCFAARRRPRYDLTIDLVGIRLSSIPQSLEDLEGNAVATNLFDYQVFFLDRNPSEILPKVIALSGVRDVDAFVSELAREIRDVDASIWVTIK
jgi:hypothetical protein